MKNNQAFTLIELLVVVLIIGILAAVALPQYQKAVYKSKYATLKNLTKSIANAAEIHYLATGAYPTDFEELNIDLPTPSSIDTTHDVYIDYVFDWGLCRLSFQNESHFTKCRNADINMDYQIYFMNNQETSGLIKCVQLNDDPNSIQAQICKQETHKTAPSKSGTGWLSYNY